MKVQVRGKNGFTVTGAIESYAVDKLSKIERYFREELDAFVVCKVYNDHHKVEVLFKGVGRALNQATAVTNNGVVSTKGVL